MIILQYFNGEQWVDISEWANEPSAWSSLGKDNYNYRTVDKEKNIILKEKTIIFAKEKSLNICSCKPIITKKLKTFVGPWCYLCGAWRNFN